MPAMEQILDIIADEIGVEAVELEDDTELRELGVDGRLDASIKSRIGKELKIFDLPPDILTGTVADLKTHLADRFVTVSDSGAFVAPNAAEAFGPLSFVLQGTLHTCEKTLFLLPDGSGSAMAYARLPRIDPTVCLVGLNSPYLRAPGSTLTTVEQMSAAFTAEILRRQPAGPYHLGGWSAGGYYAFEVAKDLIRRGRTIQQIVLIDSPCRLVFEALPMHVVQYLSTNALMGNWKDKSPPQWMIDHFEVSINAIEDYMPTPILGASLPKVSLVWAEEGLIKPGTQAPSQLDMQVRVTKMLIERPECSGPMGWDALFPSADIEVATMPGNHFTIVHPPYCNSLSVLLNDLMKDSTKGRKGLWVTL